MDTTAINRADQLAEAHRSIGEAMAHIFEVVAEASQSGEHLEPYQDVGAWLRWNLGLAPRTARLWVDMARELRELPTLRAAFGCGAISLDQLRLMLRVATPETEEELLALAVAVDVEELRSAVKDREAEQEEDPGTFDPFEGQPVAKTWWRDDKLIGKFEVPGADGVMLETALLRLAAQAPRDERTGLFRDPTIRQGEALVQMASEALASDGDHDRATLVVHVSASDLVLQTGEGWDAAQRVFSSDELQRLCCDARLQPAVDDPTGVTVGVGRTTRTIPAWLRRLAEGRDLGCRFPGCRRTRWLQIHHLRRWADGGPTNLDNLVSLCGFHHRLIHRERWVVNGRPDADLVFLDKWGSVHTPVRDRFPEGWTRRFLEGIEWRRDLRLVELSGIRAGPP